MKLYLTYVSMHLRTVLQHRVCFLIISLGQACFAITGFASVILLVPPNILVLGFSRFEILLAGSIINISFSLVECFARGFDSFGGLINTGKFDSMITSVIVTIIVDQWGCGQFLGLKIVILNFFDILLDSYN